MTQLQLRQIDPRTITIGTNVRAVADLDPAFVESVRSLGVLTPVTVNEDPEGGYVLRYGQRRTLAAIDADLGTIPALVLPSSDESTDEAQADRLVEQWAENERRAAITTSDRVGAVEQMALLNVPVKDIAARLHLSQGEVRKAKKVAMSPTARDRLTDGYTIEDAAIFAEFEGDEEATTYLTKQAGYYGGLRHAAQRLRDQRRTAKENAALVAAAEAQGLSVAERDAATALVELMVSAEDRSELDAATHCSCPGHVVYLSSQYDHEQNRSVPVLVAACSDPAGHGHAYRYGSPKASAKTLDGKMTEEAKAERRRVIENNKAHEAAAAVRGEWIDQFAKGSGLLKGAEQFIALTLIGAEHRPGWATSTVRSDLAKRVTERSKPATALRAAAAVILSQWHDEHKARDAWRRPSDYNARVLTFMESWGYEVAPVERLLMATDPVHQPASEENQTQE